MRAFRPSGIARDAEWGPFDRRRSRPMRDGAPSIGLEGAPSGMSAVRSPSKACHSAKAASSRAGKVHFEPSTAGSAMATATEPPPASGSGGRLAAAATRRRRARGCGPRLGAAGGPGLSGMSWRQAPTKRGPRQTGRCTDPYTDLEASCRRARCPAAARSDPPRRRSRGGRRSCASSPCLTMAPRLLFQARAIRRLFRRAFRSRTAARGGGPRGGARQAASAPDTCRLDGAPARLVDSKRQWRERLQRDRSSAP